MSTHTQTPTSRNYQLLATAIQHIAEHIEMGQTARLTIAELHQLSRSLRVSAGAMDADAQEAQS